MDSRYQYLDTGKEADDFVKAFVAMSNSIRQNQYNQARIEYYRALTKKALSSGQGMDPAQFEEFVKKFQYNPYPSKQPAPKEEPAPKPRSDAEPAPGPAPKEPPPKAADSAPTTPPAASDTTPKKSAFLENEAPRQQEQAALPDVEEAAPQPALASAEPNNTLFDDEKAIPA